MHNFVATCAGAGNALRLAGLQAVITAARKLRGQAAALLLQDGQPKQTSCGRAGREQRARFLIIACYNPGPT